MLTETTFQRKQVKLNECTLKPDVSHTNKTDIWYLLGVPFKISDDLPRQFYIGSSSPPPPAGSRAGPKGTRLRKTKSDSALINAHLTAHSDVTKT